MTNFTFTHTLVRPAALLGRLFLHSRFGVAALLAALFATGLPPGAGTARAEEPAPAQQVTTVNINEADAATLTAVLKGVGNARAMEIVRYREAYGPFTSVDELADVKGIGKSTLDANRAAIKLE